MTILRSILPSILALALLISTSGANVVYHYCSGELDSVSLFAQQACECNHDDEEGDSAESPHDCCPKDCCAETVTTLQTTDTFLLNTPQTASQLVCVAILSFAPASLYFPATPQTSALRLDFSPPRICDIPMLHRALLI